MGHDVPFCLHDNPCRDALVLVLRFCQSFLLTFCLLGHKNPPNNLNAASIIASEYIMFFEKEKIKRKDLPSQFTDLAHIPKSFYHNHALNDLMEPLWRIYNDSLLKNAFYLMAANFFTLIMGFFFWVIAARYYTASEVGTISALISSMLLISMISSLGFPTALVFYLPRNHENAGRIINSCLATSAAASLLFSSIFIYGLDIWGETLKTVLGDMKFAALFAFVTAGSTISALMSSAFIAGRRSSLHMTKETLFGFIKILPLPLFTGFGAMGIFLAWGVGVMLAASLGFFLLSLVWRGYLPSIALDPVVKSMAGYAASNYLVGIFSSLPRLVLPVMIVGMLSPEFAGFFFIAIMIVSLLYGIPQSISNSLLAESSGGELWDKVKKAVRFNLALILPGLLLFVLFGKFILNIFNPDYAENASTTLMILAAASLPLSVITIFTAVRNSQKKVRSALMINMATALITLALAVPLMRSYGIEGAAVAYLAANSIAAIVVIYKMNKPGEFIATLGGD